MGHSTDKIELIIMGGTFLSFPEDFQRDFVKKCYDALNGKESRNLEEAKKIPDEIKQLEEEKDRLEKINKNYLMRLPNITHETVPYGKDSSENVEYIKGGKIPKFDFKPKTHVEIAENLGLVDFDASARVSGTGFYYLKNELGLLNRALINFAIDFMVKKGYTFVIPPLMLTRKAYEGVTDLADFEKVMEDICSKDLENFFHQWLYVEGQPDLKISSETGKKEGTVEIIIEQEQTTVYSFNLDLGVKDKSGYRIVNTIIRDKITSLKIKGDAESEIIPDPDIKLLYRIINN
jgi:hypothetical protein